MELRFVSARTVKVLLNKQSSSHLSTTCVDSGCVWTCELFLLDRFWYYRMCLSMYIGDGVQLHLRALNKCRNNQTTIDTQLRLRSNKRIFIYHDKLKQVMVKYSDHFESVFELCFMIYPQSKMYVIKTV